MENFDEKVQRHIEKVMAAQAQQKEESEVISPVESLKKLKEIDMELGMTEQEWDKFMEEAEERISLADTHFGRQNYKAAYNAAEWAISVNPFHKKGLVILVLAALKIYEESKDAQYFDTAEKKLADLLLHYPNDQETLLIQSSVAKIKEAKMAKVENTPQDKAVGCIFLVIAILILGWWIFG